MASKQDRKKRIITPTDCSECSSGFLHRALQFRDNYTGYHSERVGMLGMQIAIKLGLSQAEINDIRIAGILHDLGKIQTPRAILLKNSGLNQSEFQIMKKHPETSVAIIGKAPISQNALDIILFHHRWFDGSGYPHLKDNTELKENDIPLGSRVLCVADSHDAMSSDRPYRKRMPRKVVKERLEQSAGTQFDTNVLEAFFKISPKVVKEIYLHY